MDVVLSSSTIVDEDLDGQVGAMAMTDYGIQTKS